MLKKMFFILFGILGSYVGLCYAEPPAEQVDTAEALLLYEASRNEALTTTLGIDSAYSIVDTINAGYANRLSVTNFIDSNNYFLRAIVIRVSGDAVVRLYGDGINCSDGSDSTGVGYVRAGSSLSLFFTSAAAIDSLCVIANSASTSVDAWVLATRPKTSTP